MLRKSQVNPSAEAGGEKGKVRSILTERLSQTASVIKGLVEGWTEIGRVGQWVTLKDAAGHALTWNPDASGNPRFGVWIGGAFGVPLLVKEPGFAIDIPEGLVYQAPSGVVDPKRFGYPDWGHAWFAPSKFWEGGLCPIWPEQKIGGLIVRAEPSPSSPILLRTSLTPLFLMKNVAFGWQSQGVLAIEGDNLGACLTKEGKAAMGSVTRIEVKLYGLFLMDAQRSGNFDGFFSLKGGGETVAVRELQDAM